MSGSEAKDQGGGAASEPPPRPCPICGRPSAVRFRPFCSRRCADIDLHRWLGGRYVIPASETDDEPGGSPAGGSER
jgi:endogenous inhibitor of DNA gyrase (YacG/DUF329 family)